MYNFLNFIYSRWKNQQGAYVKSNKIPLTLYVTWATWDFLFVNTTYTYFLTNYDLIFIYQIYVYVWYLSFIVCFSLFFLTLIKSICIISQGRCLMHKRWSFQLLYHVKISDNIQLMISSMVNSMCYISILNHCLKISNVSMNNSKKWKICNYNHLKII